MRPDSKCPHTYGQFRIPTFRPFQFPLFFPWFSSPIPIFSGILSRFVFLPCFPVGLVLLGEGGTKAHFRTHFILYFHSYFHPPLYTTHSVNNGPLDIIGIFNDNINNFGNFENSKNRLHPITKPY